MKKNLKYFAAVIVFIIFTIICGCSSDSSSGNFNTQSSSNKVDLLEGYPQDIMPLYKMVKIDGCSYEVRSDTSYIIGKDLYTVSYYSQASMAELNNYYRSILTYIDEKSSSEDYIEGDIKTQHTFISFKGDEKDYIYVSISLGAKKENYADENLYFTDYPKGLIESIQPATLTEQNYKVQYSPCDDCVIVQYFKIYTTKLSLGKVIKFYSDRYSRQASFTLAEDSHSSKIYWKAQEYECEISISEGAQSDYRYVITCIRKYK